MKKLFSWLLCLAMLASSASAAAARPGQTQVPEGEAVVIIEMAAPPLAAWAAQSRAAAAPLSPAQQRAYSQALLDGQQPAAAQVAAVGGQVIAQYTKAYNGLLARLPLAAQDELSRLAGVKAVHPAPRYQPSTLSSVPHIRADRVVQELGITGKGIRIAVIDTGLDYEHAALGGSGDPADYAGNNPNIIEPGHPFPTAKVIGGYDFAGTSYTGYNDPLPDPDPLDEVGHGTHVASTAAGLAVPPAVGHGVAPEASLYALKIFGKSGSSFLLISAIEWAVDPNGDGDLSDRADVINMSLGDSLGEDNPDNPDIIAVDNAAMAGIVMVISAGNSGGTDLPRNNAYEMSTPAVAASAIAVAADASGRVSGPTLDVLGASVPPTQTNIAYLPLQAASSPTFTTDLEAPLFYVGQITTDTLCSLPPELVGKQPLTGTVALIHNNSACKPEQAVQNAAELGAQAALLYNAEGRGGTTRGNPKITTTLGIPAGTLIWADGLGLIPAHQQMIVIHPQDEIRVVDDHGLRPDEVAVFTNRGPASPSSALKPDVAAPGINIFAARIGTGTSGVFSSGTSMAAPIVAGTAALVRQAHPGWAPEQVKAALMNTAVTPPDPASAAFSLSGAGRIDALGAVQASVLAFGRPRQPALSLGRVAVSEDRHVEQGYLTLQNTSAPTRTYQVSWGFAGLSPTQGFTLTLEKTEVQVPKAPALVPLGWRLEISGAALSHTLDVLPEYYGYITFANAADPSEVLRIPFYAVVQAETQLQIVTPQLERTAGTARALHHGPIASQPVIYPLLQAIPRDPELPAVKNPRFIGLAARQDGAEGGVLSVALSSYGAWNTIWMPRHGAWGIEVDLDLDGKADYRNTLQDGCLLVPFIPCGQLRFVKVANLLSGEIAVAPGTPQVDYNSGWMAWEVPLALNGLDWQTHPVFAYRPAVEDTQTKAVRTWEWGRFDAAHPPLRWALSGALEPGSPSATISFTVADPAGYALARPLGLLVLDPTGAPGLGQAYPLLFSFDRPFELFAPLVTRNN